MKPVLVTGATGFVGWHVARALLDNGQSVRALARNPAALRELVGAQPIQGDLRDPASLQRAVEGCSTVFHVAADYRLWTREPKEMYRSNVEGTRAMLEAARRAGVERFVYTSTVGCIAMPQGGIGDETMVAQVEDMQGHYKRSKLLAEHVALEFARDGFPVIIVNPTAPVGDHDFKPTPTGKIIVDFVRGAMPAYLDTGLNVVDVRDVAQGHLAACERGRVGERYILGSENMTLRQIFEALSPVAHRKPPSIQIPYAVAYAAGVVSTAWANISGQEPRAPLEGVKMARKKMWVRHDKAARELGYTPGSASAALARAVEWFRTNGYC
ncbi:MAG: hopanoid-associated sugar epimerase [Acidobacteriota bacterium]